MKLEEIYLSEEDATKLFAVLDNRNSGQTAQELAEELLHDRIRYAYKREVQGR